MGNLSKRIISRSPFWIGFILSILGPTFLYAATVKRASEKTVLIEFDPVHENFAAGDRLFVMRNEKRIGLVRITKVQDGKMIGLILKGKAEVGLEVILTNLIAKSNIPQPKDAPEASQAEATVTMILSSNSVWRGLTATNNDPAIQGQLDYSPGYLTTGLFVTNSVAPATSEYDIYAGVKLNQFDWSWTFLVTRAFFTSAHQFDAWNFSALIALKIFDLEFSYIPEFYGAKSSCFYMKGGTNFVLREKWKLAAHVGSSSFSDEIAMQYRSYIDYKLAVVYSVPEFNVEFAFTNTNRKSVTNATIDDEVVAVTISKTF